MRFMPLTACLTILASTLTLQTAQARWGSQAADFPYWYLGLNAQMAYVPDASISSGAAGITDAELDMGYGAGVSLGYRPYGNGGLRTEIEYTYRDNDFDSFAISGVDRTAQGDFISHNVMLNLFYDFETDGKWVPYVGGGLGASFGDFKSRTVNIDASDTTLAYQGMAGLVYRPSILPDTEWGFGYRYFGSLDPEVTDNSGNNIEFEQQSHNIELLSRFRF